MELKFNVQARRDNVERISNEILSNLQNTLNRGIKRFSFTVESEFAIDVKDVLDYEVKDKDLQWTIEPPIERIQANTTVLYELEYTGN